MLTLGFLKYLDQKELEPLRSILIFAKANETK